MPRGNPQNMTNAGKGRPKGVPNKMTTQVKEMILAALDQAGGVDYLAAQAEETPAAFLSLVGKVLPLQLTGQDGAEISIVQRIERVVVRGDAKD